MRYLICFFALQSACIFAGNGGCALCEVNREHNRNNPNPYTYYEDYLEAQKKKAGGTQEIKTQDVKVQDTKPAVTPPAAESTKTPEKATS